MDIAINKMRDLILSLLVLALLTAGVWAVQERYRAARVEATVAQFQLLSSLRRSTLEAYLSTARAEVAFWSSSERIARSMASLRSGWRALGSNAGAQVRELYTENVAAAERSQQVDAPVSTAPSQEQQGSLVHLDA